MNFEPTDDQAMLVETFARFLDEHSSMARVRAALPGGFDAALWREIAGMGIFGLRVPEAAGGLDLGLFDVALLMEEAGRTLASGPIAEGIVAARVLGLAGESELLPRLIAGEAVVAIALHDMAANGCQWIAGGAVAEAIVARRGDEIVLVTVPESARKAEENLAFTPLAEVDLAALDARVIGRDTGMFAAAVEEWKLLAAAGLGGVAREALRLAAAYAAERKQFGQIIGTFQAISHPLADLLCEIDGGRFLVWKAIRDAHDNTANAGAAISLALWWASDSAARTVTQALRTFGGYGLTTEYDIYLYNLRAKAWALVLGDPQRLLEEAGRRLYAGEAVALPETGDLPIEFGLGEEAGAVMAEIDALFAKYVTPQMREQFHYSWEGYVPEVHKLLAGHKLLFPQLPAEITGRDFGGYARNAVHVALEKQDYLTPAAGVAAIIAVMIHKFGSDELKRDVLPQILNGDVICSLGYSEPGSGSDVFAAQCRAVPDGDGWRIDGTKMFTSGANLSTYVLMLCRTNTEVPKHKGLTMFIVPLKAEGVTIQPVFTFQDERTNITFYDGVRVPDSWRLGEVDGGVRTMSAALELEHGGGFSSEQFALVEAAEHLCRHDIARNGRPLIEDAAAQARLARATANAWANRLLGWRVQWAGVNRKQQMHYGPMAKLFSSEKFTDDARDLLDLTAPLSLSKRAGPAFFINQCYRHAHGTTIYGGTSEVHRSVIAERGLGMPRSRG